MVFGFFKLTPQTRDSHDRLLPSGLDGLGHGVGSLRETVFLDLREFFLFDKQGINPLTSNVEVSCSFERLALICRTVRLEASHFFFVPKFLIGSTYAAKLVARPVLDPKLNNKRYPRRSTP